MWLVVSVVAVIVLGATYVTWTATRVDRLHARASAAYSALDAQSVRRAAAAAELGESEDFPDAQTAARAVLAAQPDRETAENELTRALRLAAAKFDPDAMTGVTEASRRLALARHVHTDLVRDALAVRQRPLVRLLRLTRKHPEPRFFDIDDPSLGDESP
jgi:hypothetical protein